MMFPHNVGLAARLERRKSDTAADIQLEYFAVTADGTVLTTFAADEDLARTVMERRAQNPITHLGLLLQTR